MIISYFEGMTEEQRPPRRIWHSATKCKEWADKHSPYKEGGRGGSAPMWFKDSEIERAR